MDFLHPFERVERPETKEKPKEREELEARFQAAMVEMYRQARIRCRHDSPLFARMINKRGGVSAARRLITTCKPSDEFLLLHEAGCLDYTVEALVLREEFHPLFSRKERERAAERLRRYGHRGEAELQ
jgi:hypothetical protein